MTHDPTIDDVSVRDEHVRPAAGRSGLSRRGFLTASAAAVGLGVYGLSRVGSAGAETRVSRLDMAGEALEPAVRVPPTTTTLPPTPTTTVPTIPPAPGEIMFPLIVGPDDYCFVSDSFGDCRGSGCSRLHEGVDIMADPGLAIVTPAAGELTKKYVDSGLSSGAGNGWTLYDEETEVTWKFFHMSRHEDGLEVGDMVEIGDVVGYVGNTGTSGVSTDTNHHLHFEYRPNNVPADSFPLLQRLPGISFET